MGGSFGGESSGRTQTTETAISKQQASILQQRQAQYNAFFFPQLTSMLKEISTPGQASPTMQKAASDVNAAANTARGDFRASMAQRGLAGSGAAVLGEAQLQRARSSGLANAILQAREANAARRMQLIQMGGSMSPAPTTAVGFGQDTTQSSFTGNLLTQFGIK